MNKLAAIILGAPLVLAAAPRTAAAQEPMPSHDVTRTINATATVENVDRQHRELTMRKTDGSLLTISVPESMSRFDQLKPGDRVDVAYNSALAVEMHRPGSATATVQRHSMQQSPGKRPGGVAARQRTGVVEVVSVDPDRNEITIMNPTGQNRTITVRDPEYQKMLRTLAPGDRLDVTYTEAVAVSVTPAS